ncbi:MAG: flagellar biosynthetic protein FliR [Rhodospirillales bacterium]|nr:flagellar biosynthetic protein FliR [Rhodospirillales bacterium]
MLGELLELNVFGFFLIFARVGTAMAMMPGFSSSFVSPRFALAMGLAISFVVMPPLVGRLPAMPANVAAMALILTGEILIGAFLGTISRILISSLQTAGTFIAYSASMANAMINDAISEQQSSTISAFLMTTGLVLIFVSDMHHLMIIAVIDSYSLFVPGEGLMIEDFANYLTRTVAASFAIALQMSAPFVIVALTYYIGLGILGRLMPQLQVFFFGMPFQLAAQMWVLVITTSGIMLVFMEYFRDAYMSFAL